MENGEHDIPGESGELDPVKNGDAEPPGNHGTYVHQPCCRVKPLFKVCLPNGVSHKNPGHQLGTVQGQGDTIRRRSNGDGLNVSSSQGYKRPVGSGLCILVPRGKSQQGVL